MKLVTKIVEELENNKDTLNEELQKKRDEFVSVL